MRLQVRVLSSPPVAHFGAVAQLGERRFCKPEVVGSMPTSLHQFWITRTRLWLSKDGWVARGDDPDFYGNEPNGEEAAWKAVAPHGVAGSTPVVTANGEVPNGWDAVLKTVAE